MATAAAAAKTDKVAAAAAAATAPAGPSVPLRTRRQATGPSSSVATGSSQRLFSTTSPLWQSRTAAGSSRNGKGRQDDFSSVESSGSKNVVVLGGSYGGMHAATVLAQKLPPSHRVILIERNSHFNHLYVFPRFSVLPGHEHKAFIPYTSIFGTAPKRRSKASSVARGRKEASAASAGTAANASQQQRPPPPHSQASTLEMGGAERHQPLHSTSPPSREGATSDDERSTSVSSNSHGSSARDSLLSGPSDDLTASTSWTAISDVEPDAGNKSMERAIVHDGKDVARVEEDLGRPAMQVEELGDALDKGIDLGQDQTITEDGNDSDDASSDEQVAQGFEEADPHVVLQATVTSITDSHVVVTPTRKSDKASGSSSSASKLWSIDSLSIPYTHLIYALGSHLPDPLRTVARTKPEGIDWMVQAQEQIKASQRVVLVGGGALGVEFATDIKSVYPDKDVTLIHSRQRLLPNFDERIHTIAKARLEELGVKLVLGERLALREGCPKGSSTALDPEENTSLTKEEQQARPIHQPSDALHSGLKRVRTTGGKEFICDLLMLCTGQQPNSSLMASFSSSSVDPHTRLVRVLPTLQVALDNTLPGPFDATPPCGDCDCFLDKKAAGSTLDDRQLEHLDEHNQEDASKLQPSRIPNVYAIGDVADAFGALCAGYQAWNAADIAAENIVRDIGSSASLDGHSAMTTQQEPAELLTFTPAPNMLKLSLGLGQMVFQGAPVEEKVPILSADGEPTGKTEKIMRPEITVKDDPEHLGVEGVWTFMAGASTEDLYL